MSDSSGSAPMDLVGRASQSDGNALKRKDLRDQDQNDVGQRCDKKRREDQPAAPPAVFAVAAFGTGVLLLDQDYRARWAAYNPPPPTPDTLSLAAVSAQPGYPGNGMLSLLQGNARVFLDAACTQELLDPNDNLPLTAAHPVQVTNAQLVPGTIFHVLGTQRGVLQFQLALDAAVGWLVHPPHAPIGTVTELALIAYTAEPAPAQLNEGQRIAYGRYAGVALTTRPKIRIQASNPGIPGAQLLVTTSVGGAVSIRDREWPAANDHDVTAQPQPDQAQDLWVQGANAGGITWVGLGLQLADGTVLRNGDLLRIEPVVQGAISVGFEWEVDGMLIERRHTNGVLRPQQNWEGPPSKATVFRANGANIQLDTEVRGGPVATTYGELVLGPAYSYAQLEGQLTQLFRIFNAIRARDVKVRTPAAIMSRTPGHFHQAWAPANETIVIPRLAAGWVGTAQSTFAIPLWMFPTFVANHDGVAGVAAKQHAEAFAAACAADLVNNPNRHADDLVIGLITACQYYIEIFHGRAAINDDDGPKTATPVMIRSDFHSLYGLLQTAAQRNAFTHWANNHPNAAARLMPNGYNIGGGMFQPRGPTIAAWLASVIAPPPDVPPMVNGVQYVPPAEYTQKDLMSPPPGFGRHCTNAPIKYGFGKLKTDPATGNVIAECRAVPGGVGGINAFIDEVYAFAEDSLLAGQPTWQRGGVGVGWNNPAAAHPPGNLDVNGFLPP